MNNQAGNNVSKIISSIEKQARSEEADISALSEKHYRERRSSIEAEIKKKYKRYVDYELEKQQTETNKRSSELEAQHKAALFEMRSSVSDELFSKALDMIREFTGSDEYIVFLGECLKKISALYGGKAVIYVREEDMKYESELVEAFGREGTQVSVDKDIITGGVKVLFCEEDVLVDDTLDERLREEKKDFIKKSGLGFKS